MTVKERVHASRLIEKAERNSGLANDIGLTYKLDSAIKSTSGVKQNYSSGSNRSEGNVTGTRL